MSEQLGEPVGEEFAVSNCRARFFERALLLSDGGSRIAIDLGLPMIGRPHIATGDATRLPAAVTIPNSTWPIAKLEKAIEEAVRGRLFVAATGRPEARVPLAARVGPGATGRAAITLAPVGPLEDRCLYDVIARVGDVEGRLAPHALYYRANWENFGLAHITDMHVARRIDSFRGLLREMGRTTGANALYNWNDRFRGFVRYANQLHAEGRLDVIVATGDLYDYTFEDDDNPSGEGNASWLRKLVLGEAPGPEFPDVEALRVPIFLVPGNHDYRKHPYRLLFSFMGIETITNFSGYNLGVGDALALTHRLAGTRGTAIPEEGESGARRQVEYFEDGNPPFRSAIGPLDPFVVKLGPHRIALVDSAHDAGVPHDLLDLVKTKLGWGTEDQRTFVGGSPNCRGVTDQAYDVVIRALDETPDEGLFVVALHAPLFNPWNNEYPYFLRQTQRAADPDDRQTLSFIARHAQMDATDVDAIKRKHPHWFPATRSIEGRVTDHRRPSFASRVDNADMLDHGVSRGKTVALTKRLAGGSGARRPADVVLAGHTHRHNEFIVRPTVDGSLAFSMDFYTQNPTSYYATRFTTKHTATPVTDVTYLDVVEGAPASAMPERGSGEEAYNYVLRIPPYANPLDKTGDVHGWWQAHRPLVLQTGALGPLDTAQVSFSGFRLLAVKNNLVEKVHFLSSERLERAGWRLPWEAAIAPAPAWVHPMAGQLVFYRDTTRDGTDGIAGPSVIGLGGWQHMLHLTSGGNGIIYAVDGDGRLLFYRDAAQDGSGDVSSPKVIGLGGWQGMRRIFGGGDGIIYAIDGDGRLLFYRDATRDGTGDVANPAVIGDGGWQDMLHVFSGGNGIIYAVDQAGRLLFYRDHARDGTGVVANPGVIGLGGWQQFLHLFSGGDGTIYAVNAQGQLLFYKDANQNGTGDVSSPKVIGLGGWQHFRTLFAGDNGVIYAARR